MSDPRTAPDLPAAGPLSPAEAARWIDEWLGTLHAKELFSGSVLIAKDGQVLFERHHGFADLEGRVPLSGNASYSLASVSKPFTALAILLLAHRGRLSLDDQLARHIPELGAYDRITLRHLLHHTSGIFDHVDLVDDHGNQDVLLTMPDLLALFAKHRPRPYFSAGDQFEYSNTGYVMLGEVVARASGRSYPEFMAEAIFGPLGMNDSAAFNLSSKECPLRTRAIGFQRSLGRKVRCDLNFLDGVFGDGGIYSGTQDLLRWDIALRDGVLLPRDAYAQAHVPGRLNGGAETGYGFGWEIRPGNVVEHWGEWEGFTAHVRRDLAQHSLLVVLSNQGPADAVDPICQELAGVAGRIAWSGAA
jgi:CubicO group peptidase (beta-lactamase class C family)